MKKQGFTLIELLVVIAIIAILAAILFPVFAKARETAKRSACLSNMKQMASAWIMYSDDYDGACPSLMLPAGRGMYADKCTSWMEEMYPYIKSYAVFGCPSSDYTPKTAVDVNNQNGRLTYGWNASVFNYSWLFQVQQSDLERPSDMVFISDTIGVNWLSLPGAQSWGWNFTFDFGNGPQYATRPPTDRHNGTVNVTFCDGHAGALPYNELLKTEDGGGRRIVICKWKEGYLAGEWTNSLAKEPVFTHFLVSMQRLHF